MQKNPNSGTLLNNKFMRFLIRLFYDKSQRLFRKFFTTKQTVGRGAGLDKKDYVKYIEISVMFCCMWLSLQLALLVVSIVLLIKTF